MSRLQNATAVVVSALSLLSPSLARAACSMDAECKGERICVEGRCVDPQPKAAPVVPIAVAPGPRPVSSPSSSSQPPAPPPAPPSASAPAPAAEPTVTVAQPSSGGGLLQSGGSLGWSVSLLGSATSLSLQQGGSESGFQTDAHLQLLGHFAPQFSLVGYFDSGLPLTQINGQLPFVLNTLGVGLGLGDKYRVMVGGGVTSAFSFLDSNNYMGGQFIVHGSVPLIDGVGVHVQFSVTVAAGQTLIQGGLGIGYQG